ncbi:MAG: GNAT family N-acetyltransferase [Acetobacteraceae bacterium]|nr:GNAT family N-acetyltransferase [Acetobacteraceae bacterium]
MDPHATEHEILQASPADVGDIAHLFDLYRQFYGKAPNEEAARRFLFARLSKGESVVFYARQEGKPVAFLQLYPVFSSTNLTRQWILNDLYVIAEARQHGYGRALLSRAHRLAEETQANGLVLETAVTNHAAQRLYESLGWKRDDEFYRYALTV